VDTLNNTPTSDFQIESFLTEQAEGGKHDRLLQLIQRIKKSKDKELILSGKKDFLDLVLTVKEPFDYELDMYDSILTEIFDNKLDYNIPGVTTLQNRERIGKDAIQKQRSLSDFI
jgi:hypothetical protein